MGVLVVRVGGLMVRLDKVVPGVGASVIGLVELGILKRKCL